MEKIKQPRREFQKLSDGKQNNVPSIDRLSALPDDVVCHILSFLPINISGSTTVLAKRWRYLWAHVPILDFNSFDNYVMLSSDIINKVMSLHKGQTINTFKLSCEDDCSNYEFQKWISHVISRNVRNLDIRLDYQVKLPRCLFTCKTLVDLRLSCCGDIPMNGTIYLPALKKLNLYMVDYVSDESFSHLLSGCPALEELIIESQTSINMVICSVTLNRLVLSSEFDAVIKVKSDTPALKYLKLHDSMSGSFSTGALTSLIEADVAFHALQMDEERTTVFSRSVLEFVGKLYNVKCLKISTSRMAVPDSTLCALTVKFHNLTALHMWADWRFISKFIENADNLEVLTISMVFSFSWMEPHQVPTCLSSHLKTVTIREFTGAKDGFELIRYLLMNAKVLEFMEIYFRYTGFGPGQDNFRCYQISARRKISEFQRGSKACKLKFH